MVLEKHIELVRASTNAAKHITAHELIHVRPEPVNDVVVIPNVHLDQHIRVRNVTRATRGTMTYSGNLPIGRSERLRRIPSDIVFEVVVVAIRTQFLGKAVFSTFHGVRDACPCCQRPVHSNAIVVDLVASTKHYVERHLAMSAHNIVP